MERCIIITIKVPYADGADYIEGENLETIREMVQDVVSYDLSEHTDGELETDETEVTIRND